MTNVTTQHTPGPWRWEYRPKDKTAQLCGGARPFDLTVMDFTRVGMSRAGPRFLDGSDRNILYRLCDRPDWVTPLPNREHHAHWITAVIHPDARLIAAAPTLFAALRDLMDHAEFGDCSGRGRTIYQVKADARAALISAGYEFPPGAQPRAVP